MAFNHYAKIKRILDHEPPGWYIRRINQPTEAKSFKGEIVKFDHYYRIFREDGSLVKYCKFQHLGRFASVMAIHEEDLIVVD